MGKSTIYNFLDFLMFHHFPNRTSAMQKDICVFVFEGPFKQIEASM